MSTINAISGKYRPYDPSVKFTTSADADAARVVWSTESVNIALNAIEQGLPIKATPFFESAIGIRKAGLLYRNTTSEQEEFKKCKFDILYFANKYCQLVDKTGKYNPIQLRKYQKLLLAAYTKKRNVIVLGSRQIGKTTTTAIFLLWLAMFHSSKQIALLGDKRATAIENLNKLKEIYLRLPFFMQQGVVAWNVGSVTFANGSKIITGPCNKGALVGKTINVLFLDEFAIPNPKQAKELIEFAMPTLEALDDSKLIVASTPNGDGPFKELYLGAAYKKNAFYSVKIPWYLVPGRDAKWRQQKIDTFGIDAFNEQYNCTFLSSSNSTFSEEMIKYLESMKTSYVPILKKPGLHMKMLNLKTRVFSREYIDAADNIEPVEFFHIHKDYELADLKYKNVLIQADIAEGVGGDYTILNFFDVIIEKPQHSLEDERYVEDDYDPDDEDFLSDDGDEDDAEEIAKHTKFKQIAIFRSNICSIDMVTLFVRAFVTCHMNQNTMKLVIERNTYGGEFASKCLNERYPDFMLEEEIFGRTSSDNREYVGIKIGRNKSALVKQYLGNIGTGKIEVNESMTIEEMQNFGKNEKGQYCGAAGFHDDIVMCLVGLSGYIDNANDNYMQWLEDIADSSSMNANDSDDYDDEFDDF